MPSSPKVQKETILKTAFEMLIREGYASINIKTVAQELGCSTQPISRQFGSMEGFRKELLGYCIEHLNTFFTLEGTCSSEIVSGIAKGYIRLAFDYPNMYKYLYMSEHEGERMSTVASALRSEHYEKMLKMLECEYGMPEEYAKAYMDHLNVYVHGMASYVAVGYVEASKQELLDRVQSVSEALLKNWREMRIS